MKIQKVDLEEIATRNGMSIQAVRASIASIRKGMDTVHKQFHIKEDGEVKQYDVVRNGIGNLNTTVGPFWQFDFSVNDEWKKYSVIVRGELSRNFVPIFQNSHRVILRIDSGCESGQKFNDITCDCRKQLTLAMQIIARFGEGIIINIPHQDGRGMGNPFKLATLSLQEQLHLTTVEAASILTDAGPIDRRSYGGAIAILRFLRVSKKREVCLITNNPYKFKIFEENGYQATERVPVIVPPTQHTRRHLEAKQLSLGHKDLVSRRIKK